MPDESVSKSTSVSTARGDELTPRRGFLRRARSHGLATGAVAGALVAAAGGVEAAPIVAHVIASTPEGMAATTALAPALATWGITRAAANPKHWRYSYRHGFDDKPMLRRISAGSLVVAAGSTVAAVASHVVGHPLGGNEAAMIFGTVGAASGSFGTAVRAIAWRVKGHPEWQREVD